MFFFDFVTMTADSERRNNVLRQHAARMLGWDLKRACT